MTWQGSGGQGTPGDPDDDATRVDNPVPASAPPPFTPPPDDSPTAPLPEPASPFEPGGPLADDDALRSATGGSALDPTAPPSSPDTTPGVPPAGPPPAPITTGLPPAPASDAPAPWTAPGSGGAWAAVPPDAGRLAVPGAPGLVYGGALPRFVAYVVDSVLLAIVGWIIAAPFAASSLNEVLASPATLDPANPMPFGPTAGVATVLALVLEAAYFSFLWSSGGRATIGMRILRLQIGDATTGNRIPIATAFRRWLAFGAWLNLLAFIPGLASTASLVVFGWQLILLLTTATHPQRQGLHDRFANTAMVRPVNAGSGGYVVGCIIIAVVIMALSFVSLIFLGSEVSSILSAVGDSV